MLILKVMQTKYKLAYIVQGLSVQLNFTKQNFPGSSAKSARGSFIASSQYSSKLPRRDVNHSTGGKNSSALIEVTGRNPADGDHSVRSWSRRPP